MQVYASGGFDQASFYDSSGNDIFESSDYRSYMSGTGWFNYAAEFDAVEAFSTAGGQDIAYLWGTAAAETFISQPHRSELQYQTHTSGVEGFAFAHAYGNGGLDAAYFFDSPGDDVLYGKLGQAYLTGSGFLNSADGFSRYQATSSQGGLDRAVLLRLARR